MDVLEQIRDHALALPAVQKKPAADKLGFLGKTLFIPSFFVVTGFLIDPVALGRGVAEHLPLVVGIVLVLLAGKAVAAELIGRR